MLADSSGSALADVSRRMQKGVNCTSTYKTCLLEHGVITPIPDGTFWFAIPLLKEYLAERLLGE